MTLAVAARAAKGFAMNYGGRCVNDAREG